MLNFLEPEIGKARNHKELKTINASQQASLSFLQKTQQDISNLIEDFLANKNISVDEAFEELEALKTHWKNNATTKVNLYETMNGGSIYLGDTTTLKIPQPGELVKKLVSLDQSLLLLANEHNNLNIPEVQLNFFTLKQKLRQLAPLRTGNSEKKIATISINT